MANPTYGPFDPATFDCFVPATLATTVFDYKGGRGTREGVVWCRICRAPIVLDSRVGMEHPHRLTDQDQA